jgi:hypothetical protein
MKPHLKPKGNRRETEEKPTQRKAGTKLKERYGGNDIGGYTHGSTNEERKG